MATYKAHYKSLNSTDPISGEFEFESEHRINSKRNASDARLAMLELYGNEAMTWNIVKIEKPAAKETGTGAQLQLDFREPKAQRQRRKSIKRF